jgi:radical SAM protein with 4Fe4S-binding SPASM domain
MKKKFEFVQKWSSEVDPGLANTPNKTIQRNIKRRAVNVNKVDFYKGVPIPTWIELSLIDTCNRACVFCPKSDDKIAPNTHQQMEGPLIEKLVQDLKEMNFKGAINLCGYGEPMLHKKINSIISKLSEVASVEIVTNGDTLNSKKLQELETSGISKILISMYDGEHQVNKFETLIKDSKIDRGLVDLRDRWYSEDKDYGVKLTNRAGTITSAKTKFNENLENSTKCFYPSYSLMVEWNGDIFLCPQDWQRRVAQGNMMQKSLIDIWSGKMITKYRKKLLSGKREDSPCKECNASGILLGGSHANEWEKYYSLI